MHGDGPVMEEDAMRVVTKTIAVGLMVAGGGSAIGCGLFEVDGEGRPATQQLRDGWPAGVPDLLAVASLGPVGGGGCTATSETAPSSRRRRPICGTDMVAA